MNDNIFVPVLDADEQHALITVQYAGYDFYFTRIDDAIAFMDRVS